MQEYNDFNIEEQLKKLEMKTRSLSAIAERAGELNESILEELMEQYRQRSGAIEEIAGWLKTEAGIEYVRENKKEWDDRIEKLLEADRGNMERIKSHSIRLGGKLKDLNKRKSLLIYTKNQK